MTLRARAILVSLLVGATGCVFVAGNTGTMSDVTTNSERAEARNQISEMMQESARAWTRGDLDGFMASYEDSPATTYVTPRVVIHGSDEIRDRYAPRFVPGAQHDALTFENVEVDLLAPDIANVIGYYRLMRGDSTTAYGPTSLVMRRQRGRWRIIHDHSS